MNYSIGKYFNYITPAIWHHFDTKIFPLGVSEQVSRLMSVIYIYVQQWLSDLINWSRLQLGFYVPAHQNTMPQLNMMSHPVT